MFSLTSYAALLVIARFFVDASPIHIAQERGLLQRAAHRRGVELPFRRQIRKRDGETSAIGLGDFEDSFYTVAVKIGDTTTAVELDTGSSDLWVRTDACTTSICESSTSPAYTTSSTFESTTSDITLLYGDSTTGTFASGPIGFETVSLAGFTLQNHPFSAINDTDSNTVSDTSAGILGLGFPSQSQAEQILTSAEFNASETTDAFISHMATLGPFVTRLAENGVIDQPLFAITLQRDEVDVSGHGSISIGQLPNGVDNSSLTWVPVRLYTPANGGMNPPSFAPDEIYPLRWEIPLDAVFLDGTKLAVSREEANGVDTEGIVSALIDSGNSLIRGPEDVVNTILGSVSPAYAADSETSPTLPCSTPHTLAFQIGGQMFPVDPRDFVDESTFDDGSICVASKVVATDPPSFATLYEWSLGDPFFKSNLVAFYYGNLTHPSQDPPRIGILSMVPANASAIYESDVANEQADGGLFSSTEDAAPTATTVVDLASGTSASTATDSNAGVASAPTSAGSAASISTSDPNATPTANRPSNSASSLRHAFGGAWQVLMPAIFLLIYFAS